MKAICTPTTLNALLFTCLLALSQSAAATVRYVKQSAAGTGASWSDASGDLYGMINASQPGDEVWVAAGTYQPPAGTTFTMRPAVKIYGGFAGTETSVGQRNWVVNLSKLTAGTTGRVMNNSGPSLTNTALLDGFIITGATDCAIYNNNASPAFANCTFSNNSTTDVGGGMCNIRSTYVLTNCTFSNNTAANYGGGLYNIYCQATITNCTFSNNKATSYFGGGVCEDYTTLTSTYTGCSFISNKANWGGGICMFSSSPTLIGCAIRGNTASVGGGIYLETSTSQLTNCLISGNTATGSYGGGAIEEQSSCTFTNCTICGNSSRISSGAAIYTSQGSDPVIRNCIIYKNSSGLANSWGGIINTVVNSLVQGLIATTNGNIPGTTAPLFVNAPGAGLNTGGDYHLQPCSPAINAGNNIYYNTGQTPDLSAVTTDLGNSARIQGTAVDMGAYEYAGNPVCSSLPVTLLSFSGQTYSGFNQLQWKTAGEVNTQQFLLERSTDASTFTAIATIAAAGAGNNTYNYKDPVSFNGNLYYRLKMADADGKYTYSASIILTNAENNGTSLYPNPVSDVVYLQTGNGLLQSKANVYNVNGQFVQTITITATTQAIPLQQLTGGIYIIKFGNGIAMKFMKK